MRPEGRIEYIQDVGPSLMTIRGEEKKEDGGGVSLGRDAKDGPGGRGSLGRLIYPTPGRGC